MPRSRVIYFDALNVVACFAVVAMHFNGLAHTYSPTLGWAQAFLVDCLAYWAVPIFFMLTGATLIGYRDRYDTKTFFRKRLVRVLVPYLCWSVIALVWKVSTGQMDPPVGPRSFLELIINARIIDVYWFFAPLLMIYLCMPVLSALTERRRALWYLVGVGVLFNYAIPSAARVIGISWNPLASVPLARGNIIYVLLGYLLKDVEFNRRQSTALYALGVFGAMVRFLSGVIQSRAVGYLVDQWTIDDLPCLFEAVAVFVFFRQVDWERLLSSQSSQTALARLAGCSFGVYLIHMFVLWYGLQLTGLDGGDLVWRLIGPIVAYVICVTATGLAKRIPVVRALFP